MTDRVIKRSVSIAGHPTSISLEDAFWEALKEIAHEQGKAINELVAEVDAQGQDNLSSALRLYVLETYRSRAAKQRSD